MSKYASRFFGGPQMNAYYPKKTNLSYPRSINYDVYIGSHSRIAILGELHLARIRASTGGRKVQTCRANGSVVWHALYDTMLEMEGGADLQGVFRAFCPASMSTLPSNTLILAHGKFAFPLNDDGVEGSPEFIVEPVNFAPFTMDLGSSESDSFLPSSRVPSLHLLGTVVGSVIHFSDGGKGVDLRVTTYVQARNVDCLYRCRFPSGPRWAKINIPIAGSVLAILGRPYATTNSDGSGLLIVTVEDIVYSPGTAHILDESRSGSDTTGSPRKLQVRKRKRVDSSHVQAPLTEGEVSSPGDSVHEGKEGKTVGGNILDGNSVSNGSLLNAGSSTAVVSLDSNEPDQIEGDGKKRSKTTKQKKAATNLKGAQVENPVAKTRAGLKRMDKSTKIVDSSMDGDLTDLEDAANSSLLESGEVERTAPSVMA